jgi:hypothetical protein
MSRRLIASALIVSILVSGCASTPRPPSEPNPLVEDNRPSQRSGGPGAWLDEHPMLETATFTLAVIGGLTVGGIVALAVAMGRHPNTAYNWGP